MSTITVFENIQNNIILHLKHAKNRIRICVAWLTDDEILEVLIEQAKKGIYVEILILNDDYNRAKSKYLNKLTVYNSKVYLVDNNYDNGILHHKFCLIDNFVLITGSYNWTKNAKRNDENIIIVDRNNDESTEDEYDMFFKYEYEFDNLLIKYGIKEEIDENIAFDLTLKYLDNQKKLFDDATEYFMFSIEFIKDDKIDEALTAINNAIDMYPYYKFYSVRQLIYSKQNKFIDCCNDFYLFMEDVRSDDEDEIISFKNVYKRFIININTNSNSYIYLKEINDITMKNLDKFRYLNIEPYFFKLDNLDYPI